MPGRDWGSRGLRQRWRKRKRRRRRWRRIWFGVGMSSSHVGRLRHARTIQRSRLGCNAWPGVQGSWNPRESLKAEDALCRNSPRSYFVVSLQAERDAPVQSPQVARGQQSRELQRRGRLFIAGTCWHMHAFGGDSRSAHCDLQAEAKMDSPYAVVAMSRPG
jgi:hypothetical protein